MSKNLYNPSEKTAPNFPEFCPEDKPMVGTPKFGCPPIPAAPSVVSGMDLYEAMNNLSERVNLCISNYNSVMSESYKTLHNLQRAAQENGAYYGLDEVWVEEGYYADESATYHLIHKACVDRRGEPIRMKLHLAYGNTTNSKIEQEMFNASKVEFADKMVVAIPKSENGWYGKAMWNGCPIASADEPSLYTVGFTQGGVMRVYNNGVDVNQMVRDTIVDAMGCSGVLIQNGQVTDESYRKGIPSADKQVARVVMGQNLTTREVVILTVGNENDVNKKGLSSLACANILKDYGCDIAVELCEGADAGAMDKGSLMFVPDEKKVPSVYAYWYISRKKFYTTDYERELAELVQNYGACIWQGFLNDINIKGVKAELDAEIERALNAEEVLQENIDKETARAEDAEKVLQENIDAEQSRAENAEKVLQENIDAEQSRAENAEKVLQENIDKEVARATGEEERIEGRLDEEIQRATTEEARIDAKLDEEIQRAKDAEKVLTDNLASEVSRATDAEKVLTDDLDTEVHNRTNEDAKLHQEVLTEQGERVSADTALQTNINTEASARASADDTLQGNIDAEASTRASADSSLKSELQANIDTEKSERTAADNVLKGLVDAEASARATADTNLQTVLQGNIDALAARVTVCETDIDQLESLTQSLQNQMSSLDKTVADMQTTVSNIEDTVNSMKSTVATMQKSVDTIATDVQELMKDYEAVNTALEKEISDRQEADATLQGMVSSEANRAEQAEAGIKQSIADIEAGTVNLPYVKTAGDTVTGDLAVNGTLKTGTGGINLYQDADHPDGSRDATIAVTNGEMDIRNQRTYIKITDNRIALNYITDGVPTILTNVLDGTDGLDAVNVDQLKKETSERKTADSALQASITAEANRAEGVESTIKSTYLPLSGGTMSGNLAMGGNAITGLSAPTNDSDAVNLSYFNDNKGSTTLDFTISVANATNMYFGANTYLLPLTSKKCLVICSIWALRVEPGVTHSVSLQLLQTDKPCKFDFATDGLKVGTPIYQRNMSGPMTEIGTMFTRFYNQTRYHVYLVVESRSLDSATTYTENVAGSTTCAFTITLEE